MAAVNKTWGRIVEFLNTSLGLWLLSAIFLSGVGGVASCWQSERDNLRARREKQLDEVKIRQEQALEREQERQTEIGKLDYEISYRLSQALQELNSISEQTSPQSDEMRLAAANATMEVLSSLGANPTEDQSPLFPEYSRYSLPTLMALLHRNLDSDQREDVERALARLLGISQSQSFKTEDPAREGAAIIFEKVILPRWADTAFYYIDCSELNPFC